MVTGFVKILGFIGVLYGFADGATYLDQMYNSKPVKPGVTSEQSAPVPPWRPFAGLVGGAILYYGASALEKKLDPDE